jgi:hypothetical protein
VNATDRPATPADGDPPTSCALSVTESPKPPIVAPTYDSELGPEGGVTIPPNASQEAGVQVPPKSIDPLWAPERSTCRLCSLACPKGEFSLMIVTWPVDGSLDTTTAVCPSVFKAPRLMTSPAAGTLPGAGEPTGIEGLLPWTTETRFEPVWTPLPGPAHIPWTAQRKRADSSTHWNDWLPNESNVVGPLLAVTAQAKTLSKLKALLEFPS